MNYTESIAYLEKLESLGIHLGLDRVNALLSRLGDPHKDFKSILVAGTNGKGSVIAMLEGVLLEAGYKVGMYTSPHLKSYTERIRIDGKDLKNSRFAEIVALVRKNINKIPENLGNPTLFEALTAGAFLKFSREKVDYGLLEVGLGGRLDATNVVKPEVSVVTNVDYDHTEILGQDIKKIALEKAGVIREGVPFITAAEGEALELLVSISSETHAPLYFVRNSLAKESLPLAADYISVEKDMIGLEGEKVSIKGRYGLYDELEIPLIGNHQAINVGVVIGVLEALRDNGINIGSEEIRKGLAKTKWRGRFEIISKKPLIILDGAHNPGGAKALKKSLEEIGFKKPLTLVLGILSNKDIQKIVEILAPLGERIICTMSKHPKAAFPEIIEREALKYSSNVIVAPSVHDALRKSLEGAVDQTICVTGSLFTVADAIEFFDKKQLT